MYSERIVLFVDILGFKDLVEAGGFEKVNKIYDTFRKMIVNANNTFTDGATNFENALADLSNTKREGNTLNANLFIGALALTHLNRSVIKDNKVVHEERLLKDLKWRVRNVIQGPDGYLYIGVDGGMILKIYPIEE